MSLPKARIMSPISRIIPTVWAAIRNLSLGFLPVIGVTLPLFSAGGSSEMATLLGIGLVQSVARHCRQR